MNRRRQPTKRPSRHRRRLFALQGLVLIGLCAVAWRLAYVQRTYGPRLMADAKQADTVSGVLIAPRGKLLDDQGRPLAYDLPAYTMDINVAPMRNQLRTVSAIIASAVGDTTPNVYAWASGHKYWVEWPHPIQEPAREQISARLGKLLPAQPVGNLVTFTPTEQRFYPNGVFASNAIGFINGEGIGQAGLESKYNNELSGNDGKYSYTLQADGFPVESTYRVTKPAEPGNDVKLTIDQTIQGFVEDEMNTLVKQDRPAHAAIVVMNPKTGAILAMASRPTFDPNQYGKASPEALNQNWAVNEPFEPGSTFKPIVLAAALTTHKISLYDTFMSGRTTIAGNQINDWNWGQGWGRLTFLGALEKSSNVGFAKIAEKLGWPDLLTFMKRFGYLDYSGIDLPSEGTSITFAKDKQGPLQLATSGFGQGISVTPLQEMDAIAAIANGGTLYKPYLASSIINSTTHRVIKQINPTVVRQHVIPLDVASVVNQAMIDDVNAPAGIDQVARLAGYDVAGKTGTAQIEDSQHGGYYSNRFNVSFVGYAPGWDPQFEVYVTVNWPKTPIGSTWGSTIAAPAARDILKACLQYYHIAPRNDSSTMTNTDAGVPAQDKATYAELPNFAGQTIASARAQATHLGLIASVVGKGSTVQGQWPEAGTEVARGTSVYLSSPSVGGKGGATTMPNLTRAPMRLAGEILASLGLTMNPVGTGFVVHQSVPAGQAVTQGAQVTLTLSPSPALTAGSAGTKP